MVGRAIGRVLLFCFLVAAACSPPAPAPASVGQPTPAGGPKRGGSLTLAGYISSNLDPHRATSISDMWMSGLGYNQLLRWPKDPEKGLGPEPELAESWEIAPDGLSVVLKLRRGVKYQNVPPVNGREFSAEDAKWNIERWTSNKPYFPRRVTWEPLKSIDIIDPYAIRLNLKQVWPELLVQLAHPLNKMLAKEAVAAAGDDDKFNNSPLLQIGTGPFIIRAYQKDVGAKWVRNAEYWKEGQPYVDDVSVRWFVDQTARFAAIRAGEVADMGWALTTTQYNILKPLPGIVTAQRPGTSWVALMLNNKVKPLDDVRVRRAIAYALDIDNIIKGAWQGGAIPSRSALSPNFRDHSLPQAEWPKLDVAKAKQLLAEAGYPNGFKLSLLTTSPSEEPKLAGQLIQEQLKQLGIEIVFDFQDFTNVVARSARKDFEASMAGGWAGDVVASGYFNTFYVTDAARNYMGYSNPQFDQTVAELNRTIDTAKRRDLALRAQRILIEDMPLINIVVPIDNYAWQSWLKGYSTNFIPGSMSSYTDEFWIDK